MRMSDALVARMVGAEVAAADVAVVYRRRDRRDYLEKIRAARGGSQAPLRAKGSWFRRGRSEVEPRVDGWQESSSSFEFIAAHGTWRENDLSEGPRRVSEYRGSGDSVLVNGEAVRRDDLAGTLPSAWREFVEPGLRLMLEPAMVLAAAEIIDADGAEEGLVGCTVRPRNADLFTTPLVSPWADSWSLVVHEASGRIVHAVSRLDGEIVVEHELEIEPDQAARAELRA